MEPMKPLDFGQAWWPKELGSPASSGGQNDLHYAFFPDHHRLAIKEGGQITLYDSADHQISGVSQQQDSSRALTFQSQKGEVQVSKLAEVN
jgi:hypothetical protein